MASPAIQIAPSVTVPSAHDGRVWTPEQFISDPTAARKNDTFEWYTGSVIAAKYELARDIGSPEFQTTSRAPAAEASVGNV
jgi:hypothetical protein